MITLQLTLHEISLLSEALTGHSIQTSTLCDSFVGCEDKYRAAHEYFKRKRDEVAALHVKVIQAKVRP